MPGQFDQKYLQWAVQEALLALTKSGAIRWDKFSHQSLEDFQRELEGKKPGDDEPFYGVDLRIQLEYFEDVEFTPPEPEQLAEPLVTGHSLQMSIEMLDENGEAELGLTIPMGLELAAEAEKSYRKYQELLSNLQGTDRHNEHP